MAKTRVLLVDDQREVLDGLCRALEPEFHIVGVAASGEELLLVAPTLSPQVVVLDVSMPGMSGIEAAERIKSTLPEVRVIMLSMHADELYVTEALKAGASAYVLKTSGVSELARAIREVHADHEHSSNFPRMPNDAP